MDVFSELADIPLRLAPGPEASVAMTSLPWPADESAMPVAQGVISQAVPLFDPDAPPPLKRFLLLTETAGQPLPSQLRLGREARAPRTAASRIAVERAVIREGEKPYMHREDETRLTVAGRTIGLRLGLEFSGGAYSWWQWTHAEQLWSGPIAEAWRISGHIPTHPVDRCPPTPPEAEFDRRMLECGAWQIAADAFVILFHSGRVRVTAHFKNNYFHVPPQNVPGLPVIAVTSLRGSFERRTLHGDAALKTATATAPHLVIDGGSGDTLDLSSCQRFFDQEHAGLLRSMDVPGGVLFRPFDRIEVVAKEKFGERLEPTYVGGGVRDGLPAGVNRTIRFGLGLGGVSPVVGRYTVPAEWYGLTRTLTGRAQRPVVGKGHRWANVVRDMIYASTHQGGFDTGRTTRAMHRKNVDEAEWEGGTAHSLWFHGYLEPEHADWDLITHQAYNYADIAVEHGYDIVRCHGYSGFHGPLPMQRVGALILGYVETGDPYLLETARAVADRFFHVEWGNGPRYSMGRDAYPVATIMVLYDYTGEQRYLDFSRQVIMRLLRTQWPQGGFSGQGAIGIVGGRSNRQTPIDITFASGLLAPLAVFEWAMRDSRHPEGFEDHIRRWYELALSLQSPEKHGWGSWNGKEYDKTANYPLISAAMLLSLSACHRLLQDRRGLDAMDRYLDYALASGETLPGVHGFIAPLYGAFYDMEAAGALQECQV